MELLKHICFGVLFFSGLILVSLILDAAFDFILAFLIPKNKRK